MLAYAQLLVTRSRGEVDRAVVVQNPLPISFFLKKAAHSEGLGFMGVFDDRRCLTAVRGQDTMTSKFGYGDPSDTKSFQTTKNTRVPTKKSREFERMTFLTDKEDTYFMSTKSRRWYSC